MSDWTGPDAPSEDELDELFAALALDAVDDGERAHLEQVLVGGGASADQRRLAAERYALAADLLADSVEPVEPSPGMWDRISSQLDGAGTVGESADLSIAPVADEPPSTPSTPNSPSDAPVDELAARRARRNGWTPMTTLVSVAAAVVVVLVIAGAALAFRDDGSTGPQDVATAAQEAMEDPGTRVAELAPTPDGEGMSAKVVVSSDGTTYFVGDGLPALSEDEAYQLWSVSDGEAVSVGVLGSHPETTMLSMGAEPGLLAVTVEPARGSVVATTDPVVAGELA